MINIKAALSTLKIVASIFGVMLGLYALYFLACILPPGVALGIACIALMSMAIGLIYQHEKDRFEILDALNESKSSKP